MPSLARLPPKNRLGCVPLAVVPVNATSPRTRISPTSLLLKLMSDVSWPPAKDASPCTVSTAGAAVRSAPPVTSRLPVKVGAAATVSRRVPMDFATRIEPTVAEPANVPLSGPSNTMVAAVLIVPSIVRLRPNVCSPAVSTTVDPAAKTTSPFASKATSVVRVPRTESVDRKTTVLVRRTEEPDSTKRPFARGAAPPMVCWAVPLATNRELVGS